MLKLHVFYNDSFTAALHGLTHEDPLRLVGVQEFERPTLSNEELCTAAWLGCNAGSGAEFPWFGHNPNLRSMRVGDVVTIIRGNGDTLCSFQCVDNGWVQLPTAITSTCTYVDPAYIPQLWKDNQAFVQLADDLLAQMAETIEDANIMIAGNKLDMKKLLETATAIAAKAQPLGEQVTEGTPPTLSLIAKATVRGLDTATLCPGVRTYIDLMNAVRQGLQRAARYTRHRLEQPKTAPNFV